LNIYADEPGAFSDTAAEIGILMVTHKITRTQAFDLLRITSQHANQKLADLAREVGDTGILPFRAAAPGPR
jgi:hypothetical protein